MEEAFTILKVETELVGNFLMNISVYNAQHEYGPNSVDTSANVADGQVRF